MFGPETWRWMADLADHNDRAWFAAHKADYEAAVKAPAYAFIEAVRPGLAALSPHVRCDRRALFRVHRDTRFSNDKTPFKTHVGIHLRHEAAADAHAPGLYLHLSNEGNFFGGGIWQPDAPTLSKIRADILGDPERWLAMTRSLGGLSLAGDSLKRPPRGVEPQHVAIEALKRRDHIATADLSMDDVLAADFPERFVGRCREAAPLMAALCRALGLPW